MLRVVCLGELLIDFVSLESGVSLIQTPSFKKAAGGLRPMLPSGWLAWGIRSGLSVKSEKKALENFWLGP